VVERRAAVRPCGLSPRYPRWHTEVHACQADSDFREASDLTLWTVDLPEHDQTWTTMFLLHEMTDTIRVPPRFFLGERNKVLVKLLDDKYCNRVVREVGLCVCIYDFTEVNDSYIYPADGAAHVDVKFNMVVFKPFPGEILEGHVVELTQDYVRISLGFFQDIYVAAPALPQPSEFVPATEDHAVHWSWKYFASERAAELEEGAVSASEPAVQEEEPSDDTGYYIELYNPIRVTVKTVSFGAWREGQDDENAKTDQGRDRSNSEVLKSLESAAPMVIMCHAVGEYCGMIEWWDGALEDEDGEEEGVDEAGKAVDANQGEVATLASESMEGVTGNGTAKSEEEANAT